jgi:predicted transcriptional regulator
MEVYIALLKHSNLSVEDLAERLGKDKSTVYKALQNLLKRGLVEREYKILRSGGYKYLYKPIPFSDLRKEMVDSINRWANELMNALDEIAKMEEDELLEKLETPT